jgi:transcriptional regulator with XRE-family HTH domain
MSERTYGQQLVAARHAAGMQQKELAARVGISTQHLCDVEHDRRGVSVAVAQAIARHIGVRYETPGERDLRAALNRLVNVAQEFTFHDAGPRWEELCRALAAARALLRQGEGRA